MDSPYLRQFSFCSESQNITKVNLLGTYSTNKLIKLCLFILLSLLKKLTINFYYKVLLYIYYLVIIKISLITISPKTALTITLLSVITLKLNKDTSMEDTNF